MLCCGCHNFCTIIRREEFKRAQSISFHNCICEGVPEGSRITVGNTAARTLAISCHSNGILRGINRSFIFFFNFVACIHLKFMIRRISVFFFGYLFFTVSLSPQPLRSNLRQPFGKSQQRMPWRWQREAAPLWPATTSSGTARGYPDARRLAVCLFQWAILCCLNCFGCKTMLPAPGTALQLMVVHAIGWLEGFAGQCTDGDRVAERGVEASSALFVDGSACSICHFLYF